jgi:hypothetical protein
MKNVLKLLKLGYKLQEMTGHKRWSARGWASNATANYNAETGRMNTNLAQTKWDNDKLIQIIN